jgi:hypothetical protein
VTEQTVDARVDFYRPQLTSYADAISRIAQRSAKQIYLAFLSPRILRKL